MPDTVEVKSSALDALAEEVRALREEVRALKEGQADPLPRVQALAHELGISRRTLYRKLGKRGIPVRTSDGFPKKDGDRSAAHVSRLEWDAGEGRSTRSVRKHAGLVE
jgi:predicted DNA-binding transcriptional regulator AlpA